MLIVCNKGHEEIVFHGHQCPLCLALAERDEAFRKEEELQVENATLLSKLEKVLMGS